MERDEAGAAVHGANLFELPFEALDEQWDVGYGGNLLYEIEIDAIELPEAHRTGVQILLRRSVGPGAVPCPLNLPLRRVNQHRLLRIERRNLRVAPRFFLEHRGAV